VFYERTVVGAGTGSVLHGPSLAEPAAGAPRGDRPAPRRRPGRIASDRAATVRLQVLDLLAPWVLGAATLVARLLTAAHGPTDWDSAQFVAAVDRFDVTHGRPQPPGYFLYVEAARLVHAAGPGVVASLVLVSAVASAAAAGLTVVAGRDLGGRWVGLAAGLLVATSPFAWFAGSTVAVYSFDLAVAPLLIILAFRARPHSWHGAGAVVALAVVAGFRQSAGAMFLPLALLAVLGSVRRVREALVVAGLGLAALAAWMVPMALAQPGGISTWFRSSRVESLGAADATSVLAHATAGAGNLGTFAAYTAVALLPLAALAAVALVGLAGRGAVRALRRPGAASSADTPAPGVADLLAPDRSGVPAAGPRHRRRPPPWARPWYQSRAAILVAATVPPMAVVALVQFAKGGYLLSYLPGVVIALLLAPAALLRARPGHRTAARVWGVFATVAVLAIGATGAYRFLTADGVLPVAARYDAHGLWLTQARYQAPYADTWSHIRAVDRIDTQLRALGATVDPSKDVIVIDSLDGGESFFRQAGALLPAQRIVVVSPGGSGYAEHGGSLYYDLRRTVPVAPGGSAYLVASPTLQGLDHLTPAQAYLLPHTRVADYLVWRLTPGATILGLPVVATTAPLAMTDGLTP